MTQETALEPIYRACPKCEELKAKSLEAIRHCHLAGLKGHTAMCKKDPLACWNVRCNLGKKCIAGPT